MDTRRGAQVIRHVYERARDVPTYSYIRNVNWPQIGES